MKKIYCALLILTSISSYGKTRKILVEPGTYFHASEACYYSVSHSPDASEISITVFGFEETKNRSWCRSTGLDITFTQDEKNPNYYKKKNKEQFYYGIEVKSPVHIQIGDAYGPLDYLKNGPNENKKDCR